MDSKRMQANLKRVKRLKAQSKFDDNDSLLF